MRLKSLLVDQEDLLPIEDFLAELKPRFWPRAFRMLEQGILLSQGCLLLMDESPNQSGLGDVFEIPGERWRDGDLKALDADLSRSKPARLRGNDPADVIVEIKLYNTPPLREFVGFDEPSISIDEYDERFFKTTGNKMGGKVWACAAAALASEQVPPTGKKLVAYLLSQKDLWPKGALSERRLAHHLSPLITEFKRLSGLD